MPRKTPDQLRQKAADLKKRLAAKGASLTGPKRRAAEKKIRRVQRRRREYEADARRKAGEPKAKEA